MSKVITIDAAGMEALKGSIKKWKLVLLEKEEDKGTVNCPCCRLYFNGGCDDCPIYKDTGQVGCNGTPYTRWTEVEELNCIPACVGDPQREAAIVAAHDMYTYLKDLKKRCVVKN